MKITFHGAAETVTGSNFLVEEGEHCFLVDCGMVQGSKMDMEKNYQPFVYAPNEMDFLLLTHAHIDHSGMLPKLVKHGFKGTIYCTPATADLLDILLPDSAHIQSMETERFNKKRMRKGLPPIEPVYTQEDVVSTLKMIRKVALHEVITIGPDLEFEFGNAGHILGSAFCLIKAGTGKDRVRAVFSGDVGKAPAPILKDPESLPDCDVLIMESTYGNRIRKDDANRQQQLRDIIKKAEKTGGRIIIPSFAVGRTQEMLYCISDLMKNGEIDPIDVIVDSPMAINATETFWEHRECYDDATMKRLESGDNPFNFPRLTMTATVEESKAIQERKDHCIILSASGMCTAGRIKHHLRNNIFKPETTVLFVGYQGRGTLGRLIVEGAEMIRIHGQEIAVRANIEVIHGFSAHADQRGLLDWATSGSKNPGEVILVHGEPDAQSELANCLRERGIPARIPSLGDSIEVKPGGFKHLEAVKVVHKPESMEKIMESEVDIMKEELVVVNALRTQLDVLTDKVEAMSRRIADRISKLEK
jgi:metallo-beta-lactamase family protein